LLGLEFVAGVPYGSNAAAREAVINETLARMLFGDGPAVGRTVLAEPPVAGATFETYRITGVVRDSYYTGPTEIAPLFHTAPARRGGSFLVVRPDRPDIASRVRAALRGVEPSLDISLTPVIANMEDAIEYRRFAASLAWAIGALGLALAAIGVFGVFAYSVEERRQEIGIRLALGARARDVVRALLGMTRWSVGGGIAAGLLLSLGVGVILRSYLFGLNPLDPVAYLAVAAILTVAGLLASVVPVRRALRVDPALTLKSE
jgi:hypothetical protein